MAAILIIWVLHKSGEYELYKIGFQSWQVCIAARDHMIKDRGYGAECVAAGQAIGRLPPLKRQQKPKSGL